MSKTYHKFSTSPTTTDDISKGFEIGDISVFGTTIYTCSNNNLNGAIWIANPSTTDLSNKVDKITGKGLSTEDFTTTEKSKLANITEIFTTALKTSYDSSVTWISTNGTNLINHLSNTSNPHNTTKAQVGLTNADDTSDANKPISTATQNGLDLKANLVGGNTFSNTQIFNVEAINNSPTVSADGAELGRFGAVILRTCRGTLPSPSALQNNDIIGGWLARSYNGTAYTGSGVVGLRGFATQNHTTTANGSKLVIETIANGTIVRRAIAEFGQDGSLNLLGNVFSAGSVYINKLYVFNGLSFSHEINGNPTVNRIVTLPDRNFTVAGIDDLNGKVDKGVNNSTTLVLSSATLNSIYASAPIGFRVYCTSIIAGAMTYEKTPTGWVGFTCMIP